MDTLNKILTNYTWEELKDIGRMRYMLRIAHFRVFPIGIIAIVLNRSEISIQLIIQLILVYVLGLVIGLFEWKYLRTIRTRKNCCYLKNVLIYLLLYGYLSVGCLMAISLYPNKHLLWLFFGGPIVGIISLFINYDGLKKFSTDKSK